MNNQTFLREVIEKIQKHLEFSCGINPIPRVELFQGFKSTDYWLPMMKFNSKIELSEDKQQAWYVEIFVDGKCIFRDSWIPGANEDIEIIKEVMAARTIENVMTAGIILQTEQSKKIESTM